MTRMTAFVCLLVLSAIAPPLSLGQAKAAKLDEAAVRSKLLGGAFIEGKLTDVDVTGAERKFTIEYTYQTKTAKPAGLAKYTDAARRYNTALNVQSTALDTIKKLYAQVKEAEKDAFEIEETPMTFKLSAKNNLIVRNLAVPTDKSGKELRLFELQKLKDPRYPGYLASEKDLAAEKDARVYVDKKAVKAGMAKDPDSVYPITMIVLVPPSGQGETDFQPVPLK